MAGVIRVTFIRSAPALNQALFANKAVTAVPLRNISGKVQRACSPNVEQKPKPWPYLTKRFNLLSYFYDKTSARFDENSKVIVVEGPIAAGKSALAKELAADLDMLYLPEANLDMIYTNDYGYNLKKLDEQLPLDCRSFDVDDFCRNPKHRNTAGFQMRQYVTKFEQYIDALAHLLSTGQGIVMDRCAYSDFVFVEAMYGSGYLSKGARSVYYDVRKNTIDELLKPHLVIYLDMPVAKVLENVQKRALPYERNSQIMNDKYLTAMDEAYKKYLNEISKHAELLIYDWSEPGETEIVVEDIERIDFDRFDHHDPKMEDWRIYTEEDWAMLRYKYTAQKSQLLCYMNVPRTDVPELMSDADDRRKYYDAMDGAPGGRFIKGYNADMGDTGILFKSANPKYEPLPRIERRLTK